MKLKPFGILLGLAGNVAMGWGLYHLLAIGSCGGEYPPCPAEATPYFIALPAGIVTSVVATFLGGGVLSFSGVFGAIAVASLLRAANGGVQGDTTFPLLFGLCFAGAALIPAALGVLAVRMRRRAERLVAEGAPGIATVLSVEDTGVTINNNPRVRLRVRIDPEQGGGPFDGQKTVTVPRVAIPREGDRYPVWYDRDDPATFGLGTQVEAHAAPQIRALFAKAGRHPAAAGSPPPAPAPPVVTEGVPAPVLAKLPGPPGDWVAQLGKLNELRMAGALTDEQFEVAKAKLLGQTPQPAGL